MGYVRVYFRWFRQPQFVAGILTLCLCIAGLGPLLRTWDRPQSIALPRSKVKGAAALVVPDCAVTPCLALSFDDGPHGDVTPRILDILSREQVRATFFLVGERIAGREPIVRRMHGEGHEIGNHSWNHADFSKLSPADIEMQLRLSQQAIARAGVPAPRLFRPPYGATNPMVVSHINLPIVRWNIDPEDWRHKDPVSIQQNILAQARPGGVILLHDTDPATADALQSSLSLLRPHYQFVTVSQLLELVPGDQGQYLGR